MKAQTVDEIIGDNLARLRKSESLTVEQAAGVLELVTGQSFSLPKLWRWEQGKYRFKTTDLFLMSQFYGVNVMAFFRPADPTITHVHIDGADIPKDDYLVDFFIDPRGAFITRATTLIERSKQGSRTVYAALADIEDRLADKAGPGDLYTAIQQVRRIVAAVDASGVLTSEDMRFVATVDEWWKEATKDIERNDDGDTQEDE